jgi:integrase
MGRRRTEPGSWQKVTVVEVTDAAGRTMGYKASALYKSPVDGRFKRRSRAGRTRAIAKQNLEAYLEKLAGLGVDSLEATTSDDSLNPGDTVAKLLAVALDYKAQRGVAEQSMRRYRSSARHIERSLGHWRIDELTVGRVNKLMRELADRPTTARNAKILLSEMTELAHAERALANNPMLGAITPKTTVKDAEDIVIVRPQEASQIFRAIAEHRQGPGVRGPRPDGQLLDLFQLQAGSGLRIGEALALRRSSVLPPTGTQKEWRVNVVATIVDAKGEAKHQDGKLKTSSSARNIPVTGWAIVALQRRLAATAGAPADSPLFPSARGTWRSPNKFDSQWRAILRAHPELPRITSHAWRRTVATAVEGVSERYARKLLGHKVSKAGEDETLHKHYVRRGRFVELDKRAMKAIRHATIERPVKEQAAS